MVKNRSLPVARYSDSFSAIFEPQAIQPLFSATIICSAKTFARMPLFEPVNWFELNDLPLTMDL